MTTRNHTYYRVAVMRGAEEEVADLDRVGWTYLRDLCDAVLRRMDVDGGQP